VAVSVRDLGAWDRCINAPLFQGVEQNPRVGLEKERDAPVPLGRIPQGQGKGAEAGAEGGKGEGEEGVASSRVGGVGGSPERDSGSRAGGGGARCGCSSMRCAQPLGWSARSSGFP